MVGQKCPILAIPIPAGDLDHDGSNYQQGGGENDSRVRLRVVRPHETESRLSVPEDESYERPATRADCQPGGDHYHRPCPYVACVHNLFLDVDDEGKISGGKGDPWEQDPDLSCSLDVVDEHPNGLVIEEISEVMQAKIDEMHAVETRVLEGLKAGMSEYRDKVLEGEGGTTVLGDLCSNFQGGVEKGLGDYEDDRSGRVLPDRLQILDPPPPRRGQSHLFQRHGSTTDVPEPEYLRAVWKVYERSSRSRMEDIEAAANATWILFVDVLLGIAEAQLSRPKRARVASGA
jgi:hypothetical protein